MVSSKPSPSLPFHPRSSRFHTLLGFYSTTWRTSGPPWPSPSCRMEVEHLRVDSLSPTACSLVRPPAGERPKGAGEHGNGDNQEPGARRNTSIHVQVGLGFEYEIWAITCGVCFCHFGKIFLKIWYVFNFFPFSRKIRKIQKF